MLALDCRLWRIVTCSTWPWSKCQRSSRNQTFFVIDYPTFYVGISRSKSISAQSQMENRVSKKCTSLTWLPLIFIVVFVHYFAARQMPIKKGQSEIRGNYESMRAGAFLKLHAYWLLSLIESPFVLGRDSSRKTRPWKNYFFEASRWWIITLDEMRKFKFCVSEQVTFCRPWSSSYWSSS